MAPLPRASRNGGEEQTEAPRAPATSGNDGVAIPGHKTIGQEHQRERTGTGERESEKEAAETC